MFKTNKNTSITMNYYADANCIGLYNYEDNKDIMNVKNRTGYTIFVSGAPALWTSKLQGKLNLATMEAKYIALGMALKELILMRGLVTSVCSRIGLELEKMTQM